MSVTWGSIANSKGRIGIDASVSNTSSTTVTVTIAIWFWSKYGVSDTSNTLYFNDNKSSATTSKGSVSVSTSVSSGDGWSTSNQKKLKTYTVTLSKGTSAKTRKCSAKLTGIEAVGATMSVTASYTVPALTSYTITYNANGGEGAPSKTTGYVGKSVKLSSSEPERDNYEFLGWATTKTATTAKYQPGASVSFTANTTLYAVWVQNVYKITYTSRAKNSLDAVSANYYNTGYPDDAEVPETQLKTAGVAATLSTTVPILTGYTFKYWIDSSANTYSPGAKYTADKALALGGVWDRWKATIKFNANGGNNPPSDIEFLYDTNRLLPTEVPTNGNSIFKCWCTTADETDDDAEFYYANGYYGENFSTNGETITLYAIWTTRDVLIYDTGEIECIEFIEDSKRCINNLGKIHYPELIEGDTIALESGSITCTEFIEK